VEIENQARYSLFHGLLFVFDISDSKLKLRSNFSGRCSVIHDPKKFRKEIAKTYKNMPRFDLPDMFEEQLEAYTTDAQEAQRIITPELLTEIDTLARQLADTKQQHTHWDDRVAFAAEAIYQSLKTLLLSPFANTHLPSEKNYNDLYKIKLDITKADPQSDNALALHEHFEIEYFDDKLIITIPYLNDLYETDSLFSPALNNEDADLLFAIMHFVSFTASHLNSCK